MSDEVYIWCLHCERVYLQYEQRLSSRGFSLCAYRDCDGDGYMDAWSWDRVRLANGYPCIPQRGVFYPLYSSGYVDE